MRRGRVCREPPRHPVLPNSAPGPEGPNSRHHPPRVLGEEAPLLLSLPLRGPGTTPMKQTPHLPPAPGESRGLRQEGWLGAHRPLLLQALFLAFLTSSWQQGDPALPAGSWALPAAHVQLGFLPASVRGSACGGVTTGGGPGCQGGQERSGVSPAAGPRGQSQPISFHCL